MQKHGKRRSKWFRENVMPIGIEQSQKGDLVPKEIRKHSGVLRRGKSWIPSHISEMKRKGWLDLHEAAELLGIAYNYARKCASDGRIKTITYKGIRNNALTFLAHLPYYYPLFINPLILKPGIIQLYSSAVSTPLFSICYNVYTTNYS